MALAIVRPPFFDRQAKKALKNFPLSITHFDNEIAGLSTSPKQGDQYPGFNPFEVRKIRVGLPEYRISPRNGLRVIFLHLPDKGKVVPLVCYLKKDFGAEHEVKKLIRESLKQLEQDIAAGQ